MLRLGTTLAVSGGAERSGRSDSAEPSSHAGCLDRRGRPPSTGRRPTDIEVSERVTDEFVTIATRLGDEVQVLSPFDACPDNNVRTVNGLRLIDFEGATVAHPAWDVAYLWVPWPSCWCAWRMPDAVAGRAEQAWQVRLRSTIGSPACRPDWSAMDAAIQLASLIWCLVTVGWFLPRALADRRAGGGDRRSPPLRDVVQHRLSWLPTPMSPASTPAAIWPVSSPTALTFDRRSHQLPIAPAFRRSISPA